MTARQRLEAADERFQTAKRNLAYAQIELDRAREDLSDACAEALEEAGKAAVPPQYEGKIADDMLSGAREIAAFIGKPERSIYQLAEKGHIPTFKLGGTLYARKSELEAHMQGRPA